MSKEQFELSFAIYCSGQEDYVFNIKEIGKKGNLFRYYNSKTYSRRQRRKKQRAFEGIFLGYIEIEYGSYFFFICK